MKGDADEFLGDFLHNDAEQHLRLQHCIPVAAHINAPWWSARSDRVRLGYGQVNLPLRDFAGVEFLFSVSRNSTLAAVLVSE